MLTITLKHPITVDGAELSELTLRRPKVRDLKISETKKGEMEQTIFLMAMLSQQKPTTIEDLDASDFKAVADELGNFLKSAGEPSQESSS